MNDFFLGDCVLEFDQIQSVADDELIPPLSVLSEQFHDAVAMRKS